MDERADEEKVIRIRVRDGDGEETAAGRHPAGGVEPPIQMSHEPPAAEAPGASAGSADADEVFTVDLSAPAAEEPTVARSKYLEVARENLRLSGELKKLQGEAYQDKARAQGAEGRIQSAESRANEHKEQLARTQAEFQNFRRRIEKEREDALRYANAELLRDLLPVLDNFERAIKSVPANEVNADFYKGIELIYKQLRDVLASWELKELAVLGEVFDPNYHEAVTRSPHPTIAADRIVTEHQKGYTYKERLLRPALVGVSVGQSEEGDLAAGVQEGESGAPEASTASAPPGSAPGEDGR